MSSRFVNADRTVKASAHEAERTDVRSSFRNREQGKSASRGNGTSGAAGDHDLASLPIQRMEAGGEVIQRMRADQMALMRLLEQQYYSSPSPALRARMQALRADLVGAADYSTDRHAQVSVQKLDGWIARLPAPSSGATHPASSGSPATSSSGGGAGGVVHSTPSVGASGASPARPMTVTAAPVHHPPSSGAATVGSGGGVSLSRPLPSPSPSPSRPVLSPASSPSHASPAPSPAAGAGARAVAAPPQTLFTTEVSERRRQRMIEPSGPATHEWDASFSLSADTTRKSITVTIRLATAADPRTIQQWSQDASDKWSNRFHIHVPAAYGDKAGDYPITVVIAAATASARAHYRVNAVDDRAAGFAGSRGLHGTSSMYDWGVHDRTDVPHEVGHMLGNYDEYYTVNDVEYTAPSAPARRGVDIEAGNIMNDPKNNPMARHYDLIARKAAESLGVRFDDITLGEVGMDRGGGGGSAAAGPSSRRPAIPSGMAPFDPAAVRAGLRSVAKGDGSTPSAAATTPATATLSGGGGGAHSPSPSAMPLPTRGAPTSAASPSRAVSRSAGGGSVASGGALPSALPLALPAPRPLAASGGAGDPSRTVGSVAGGGAGSSRAPEAMPPRSLPLPASATGGSGASGGSRPSLAAATRPAGGAGASSGPAPSQATAVVDPELAALLARRRARDGTGGDGSGGSTGK